MAPNACSADAPADWYPFAVAYYSFYITTVINAAAMLIIGSVAVITKANYHPRVNPITNPKNVIENVIMNVGTFSPMAP